MTEQKTIWNSDGTEGPVAITAPPSDSTTEPTNLETNQDMAVRDELDEFTNAYIVCALWSTPGDDGDCEFLDAKYSRADIASETLEQMIADCKWFQEENRADIEGREQEAGYDFWLTRNGHGAGFWDGDWPEAGDRLTAASKKFKEVELYVGDDGRIYA